MMKSPFKNFLQNWQGILFISSSIAGLLILGSYLGLFRSLEWAVLDQFFRIRPKEEPSKDIVIVTIDESDIQFVKQWPMSDTLMAQLIENINVQQPSVIALDVYRDLPVEPGHQRLVKLFEKMPNLIGIEKSAGNPISPPPALAKKGQVAANDLLLDVDGKIRRGVILLGKPNGSLTQGLGVKPALIFLEKKGIKLTVIDADKKIFGLGKAKFVPLSKQDGFYTQADMGGYQILLNYQGGLDNFYHLSLQKVLKNQIPQNFFRDKIVFFGSKAPSLNDNYLTPYNSSLLIPTPLVPGVVIHANLTNQILKSARNHRPMLRAVIKPINWILIGFWSGYGAIFGSFYIHRRWLTLGSVGLAGILIFSSSYFMFLTGWLVPVFTPVFAVISATIVSVGQVLWRNLLLSYRQLEDYAQNLEKKVEERTKELFLEKEKSERLLLNILPEVIAHQLKEDQHSIAEYFQECTILFSDIVGFTPLSSRLSPIKLVALLNKMFSIFDQLAEKYELEKIKTIGDAYMVAAGLPTPREDHTQAIAEMALEMQAALINQFEDEWNEQFEIRVGIHTGPVVAGVIGTKKFIYDLWGDTVNVASRMESSGKPGQIHVSADTYEKLKHEFILEERGIIPVKGKGEMRTYWLLGKKG